LQRLVSWLAGGLTSGLVVSFCLWLLFTSYTNTLFTGNHGVAGVQPRLEETMLLSLVQAGIKDPQIQAIIKNEVVKYLKSPEGRASLAELFKSPEMKKSLAENLKSPELQAAILELMQIPEFRQAVITAVNDTPEMKILLALAAAIMPEVETPPSYPAANKPDK